MKTTKVKNAVKFFAVLGVVALVVACSTSVAFRVNDRDTGEFVPEYTITVDGKTLHPGETVKLSTADWKKFRARAQANGYRVEEIELKKKLYPIRAVIGIFFWPELGWCYGPENEQTIYLIKNK
jgi:hypothetical protein